MWELPLIFSKNQAKWERRSKKTNHNYQKTYHQIIIVDFRSGSMCFTAFLLVAFQLWKLQSLKIHVAKFLVSKYWLS